MTRKVFALFLLAGIAACGNDPPPVTKGKCVVLEYRSRQAWQQSCTFEGYRWSCINRDCVNVGEATGELVR